MAINLNQEPDYSPLVNTLIDKTRDGKLNWMPTAVEDTFIATAKGLQSYEIRRLKRERDFVVGEIEPNPNDVWEREAWELAGEPVPVRLLVKGKEGKTAIELVDMNGESNAYELWKLAQRIALRLDERIEEAVSVLNAL